MEGGKICPDTYTVRDLQKKINPIVIDRKPDPIIQEYHVFIVSALVLTTFAMYNLAHSISSNI